MTRFLRENRLRHKEDFQSVFTNGKKIKQKFFLLRYSPNQLPCARLGIIIAKSAIKQAVKRNYHRRIIREKFRDMLPLLKGLDIVVILRSECTPHDSKSLRDDVENLWPRLIDTYVGPSC